MTNPEFDYGLLRQRYNPNFKPTEKGYVLLATHNYKADSVNASELAKLPGRMHSFEAKTEGEFPDPMFPCNPSLQLKVGAQVVSSATSGKKEKDGIYRDALALHRQGKKAHEIAVIRGLTVGTVKHHLTRWIASGEIDVHDPLPAETIDLVMAFIEERKGATVSEIRSGLGDKFDYSDIRMIVSHALRIRGANISGVGSASASSKQVRDFRTCTRLKRIQVDVPEEWMQPLRDHNDSA